VEKRKEIMLEPMMEHPNKRCTRQMQRITKGMKPSKPDRRKLYRAVAIPASRIPGWLNSPRLGGVRNGASGIRGRLMAQSRKNDREIHEYPSKFGDDRKRTADKKIAVVKGGTG
jgi:hypothetical protein